MGSTPHRRTRRILAAGAFVLLGASCDPVATISPATPEPGPPAAVSYPTLPAGASSMWQTNDGVWSLALVDSTLYAGGDFTSLRAPDAAQGVVGQSAGRIAAFDKDTGEPISSFNHTLDARVTAIAVSPDKSTLYVGGLFSVRRRAGRNKVAAFDLTSPGAPLKAWNPSANSQVRALAVDAANNVYVGGTFTSIGGTARANVARVSGSTGAVDGWNAVVDGPVDALATVADHVWIGGNFNTVNGAPRRALAHTDNASGRTTYPSAAVIPAGVRSDVKTIVVSGGTVYIGAEGTGTGVFDGTAALNGISGAQVWRTNCLGATQALAVIGDVLYDGSHAHDCGAANAFGQFGAVDWRAWHHLMGLRTANGNVLDWFPVTNSGPRLNSPPAANELGPRALTTDGTTLYVGGQFSRVNGAPQQGLTRFTPSSPPQAPVAVTNAIVNRTSAGATVRFSGISDKDSGVLSYRVYRNGALISTIPNVWAHFWQGPLLTVRDATPGASPSYRIDAVDEGGRVTPSAAFTPTTNSTNYYNAVRASAPIRYWRFGEISGTTAADSSGRNVAGTYDGSLNQNVLGAVPSNRAIHLGGTGKVTSTGAAAPAPNVYTIETWIRTTTKTGGRIVGMGNQQTANSTGYDRLLFMSDNGQLVFGNWYYGARVARSDKSYNDGYWHHVVATQDGVNGLRLYVDGEMVGSNPAGTIGQAYNGWWRVGADSALNRWPGQPTSLGFNGDIDELAIYGTSLPVTTTRRHISAE